MLAECVDQLVRIPIISIRDRIEGSCGSADQFLILQLATNSGNITLHSEVAYDSYLAVVKSLNIPEDPPRRKPKLLLMTVEPVFEDFKLDPIGSLFDVIVMPSASKLAFAL